MRLTLILSLAGSASFSFVLSASAQDDPIRHLWNFSDEQFVDYSSQFVPIHDFDGDGFRDLLIGKTSSRGSSNPSKFTIFSGYDAQVLLTEPGSEKERYAGFATAVATIGDQNQDGIPDFLISIPGAANGGRIEIRSGLNGYPIDSFEGLEPSQDIGRRVSSIGDIDQDGLDEVVFSGGGTIVRSSATGAFVHRFPAGSFSDAGDLDGDLVPDLVIGAHRSDLSGEVLAYSGASGDLIWRTASALSDGNLGFSICAIHDINQDGVREILTGNPRAHGDRGIALILDGATGQTLRQFDGLREKDLFGYAVTASEDMNGDGTPDYAIGARRRRSGQFPGHVVLIDGLSHEPMTVILGHSERDNFGSALAAPGDIDGDSRADVVVFVPGQGRLEAYGYNPVLESDRDFLASSSSEPTRLRINFGTSESNKLYRILASYSGWGPTLVQGFSIPLSRDELFDASLEGLHAPGSDGFVGRLDAAGRAQAEVTGTPFLARFVGGNVSFCAVTFDRLGGAFIGRRVSFPLTLPILP